MLTYDQVFHELHGLFLVSAVLKAEGFSEQQLSWEFAHHPGAHSGTPGMAELCVQRPDHGVPPWHFGPSFQLCKTLIIERHGGHSCPHDRDSTHGFSYREHGSDLVIDSVTDTPALPQRRTA